MTKNYYIANTQEQKSAVLEYLMGVHGVIAVDTETTSADPFSCDLLGISFSCKEGEAFYIPVDNGILSSRPHFDENHWFLLDEILRDSRNLLVMHNSVFDILVFKNTLRIDCRERLHADTILMKHTVDESRPHGLKETAMKYLGAEWGDDREDLKASVLANGGKWSKAEKNFDKADLDILGKYACADADMTFRLYNLFEQKLIDQNLHDFFYKAEVMPLNYVVINMVERGIKVDVDYYTNLKKELEKEVSELESKVHEDLVQSHNDIYTTLESHLLEKKVPIKAKGALFEQMFMDEGIPLVYNKKTGNPTFTQTVVEDALKDTPDSKLLQWRLGKITEAEFLKTESDKVAKARKTLYLKDNESPYIVNLGSNDQLGELLFKHLGEVAEKKTDGGKPQVDDEILEKFVGKYKFIEYLLQLKKVRKLLSTYVEAAVNKNVNGVIHPNWLQFGTESGRFSCVNPNYQNLPREDKRIKKGIIAREGMVLIGADYAQLEARCFAHCSNEKKLIDAFKDNNDFYGTLAIDLFGLDCKANEVKEKYPDIRFKSKVVGLATTYGAGKYRLSSLLNTTVSEAEKFRENYFKKYTSLAKYIRQCQGHVLLKGWIANETGRIRHFPDIKKLKNKKDRVSKRQFNGMLNLSVNFPIQSLAASIINRAIIAMSLKFITEGIDANVIMMVHDSVVVECEEGMALKCHKIIQDCMENTYKLNVALSAIPQIGKNVGEV